METCANCDRTIGKMETPHIHVGQVVCAQCKSRLDPPVAAAIPAFQASQTAIINPGYRNPSEVKAYGLTQSGAVIVGVAGLLFVVALFGVPMLIWAILADLEVRRLRRLYFPNG